MSLENKTKKTIILALGGEIVENSKHWEIILGTLKKLAEQGYDVHFPMVSGNDRLTLAIVSTFENNDFISSIILMESVRLLLNKSCKKDTLVFCNIDIFTQEAQNLGFRCIDLHYSEIEEPLKKTLADIAKIPKMVKNI